MRTVTIQRPVVDLKSTGAQIRRTSRRLHKWKLLTFALARIGIKSQNHFTVYAWDRERRLKAGKMLRWSILSESPSSYAAKASGSGLSGTESRIRSTCKGATVEKGLAVQGKVAQTNRSAAKKAVQDWLAKLGK